MKNKRWTCCWATLAVLIAGVCLMVGSWIGSLYELPVQNMLSAEGIRWTLQRLLPNVEASPWFTLFILVIGLGVLRQSGLVQAVRSSLSGWRRPMALSRKRRQALGLASLCFAFYVLALCFLTFSRHEMLLGITGTLARSPFMAGWPLLFAMGLILPGGVYGLASGTFRGIPDLLRSFSSLFAPMADFFVYLFCAAQFLGMFTYTCLDAWLGIWMDVLSACLYYLPFVLDLLFLWRVADGQVRP